MKLWPFVSKKRYRAKCAESKQWKEKFLNLCAVNGNEFNRLIRIGIINEKLAKTLEIETKKLNPVEIHQTVMQELIRRAGIDAAR